MGAFLYSDELLDRFPDVRGGVIHATALANGPSPPDLKDRYLAEQATVKQEIGDTPLSEIPSLAAWRRAFTGFGVKPTQYRNAAESLLRRLTKRGDIPTINLLVDMANLISIKHRVPIAVFDQRNVSGETTVRFATGMERFTDLGSDTASTPESGEVIFVDDAGVVSARRWCWRQSAGSAAGPETVETLITIEGQHDGADETVASATKDMVSLLHEFQPGSPLTRARIGPGSPRFDF
jgi:DNA/RNA-binding domain of Phe-tRNA-synthetase-like protein